MTFSGQRLQDGVGRGLTFEKTRMTFPGQRLQDGVGRGLTEEKVRDFPNPRRATIGRRIFTRHPPPAQAGAGVRWHGLEELYG